MGEPEPQSEQMKRALKAKEKAKELLDEVPGISGIGISWDSKGRPIVKVNLHQEAEKAVRKKIPKTVDGIRVKVEMVGDIFLE
jgi:hypothetical protein